MKRSERIKIYILSNYNTTDQFTATQIANTLQLQRCDVSSELNSLVEQGLLEKQGTRPVYFKLKSNFESEKNDYLSQGKPIVFQQKTDLELAIDSSNILKKAWQLAKMAISYPPHGLNALLTGSTGVGKSYMAEAMWKYACENGLFQKDKKIPFVTFNCADYVDNPQLLQSRLFGYAKGTFTGADKDTPGLIEEADGGILFLDEIHRLPPSGQEMLFTIIDHSYFRRMGENIQRKVSIMLLCATTANPSTSLLDTYLRRFPVHIHIPDYSERSPKERLNIVTDFFSKEAITLNMPIYVSGQALLTLISYDGKKGNIGEIKNIINLCCAKSYLKHITNVQDSKEEKLEIDTYELPVYIFDESHSTHMFENFVNLRIFNDGITVYPYSGKNTVMKESDAKYSIDLYSYVQQKIQSYKNLRIPSFDIKNKINNDLDTFFDNIIKSFDTSEDEDTKLLYGIIGPTYYDLANQILKDAEIRFNRVYSQGIYIAFALHLQEFHTRIDEGKIIYNDEISDISDSLWKEMNYLREIRPSISLKLNAPIPDDELGFWAKFISENNINKTNKKRINLIVVCHGEHIAHEYAQLVGKMMHTDCIHPIDAPLNLTFNEVFSTICETIKNNYSEKGVLILADMGSLIDIENKLIIETGVYCRVLPIVNSLTIMEAAKSITLLDQPLDALCSSLFKSYLEYLNSKYLQMKEKQTSNINETVNDALIDKYIITICSTGYGSAKAIKTLLEESFNDYKNLKIINVSLDDDLTPYISNMGNKLKMIIGSINPGIAEVPFVNLEKALTPSGQNDIRSILNSKDKNVDFANTDEFMLNEVLPLIETKFDQFAPSVDKLLLKEACEKFYTNIHTFIKDKNERNAYVNLLLHFVCMVERITRGDIWKMPSYGKGIIKKRNNDYIELKLILNESCEKLNITISDAEIANFLIII